MTPASRLSLRRATLLFSLLFLGPVSSLYAGASIASASGIVQTQGAGQNRWTNVPEIPYPLTPGDQVRTGRQAKAVIKFDDGSYIELGPDATFALEDASKGRSALRLHLGTLRAYVNKLLSRRFEVRTPTAVCSVRGTEFQVSVLAGGRTTVDLYKGLLGVQDNRGNEVLLKPNERLRVDVGGMGVPQSAPSPSEAQEASAREEARREVQLDMAKEDVLAAAEREKKLAEFQQGKALVDVSGNRVRIEEYILRPKDDQFKLVVLNERENRFDYFYYLGTFNKTLPTDLSSALRQIPGGVDSQPEYYLTGFETGRSNTVDSIREVAQLGHLVDVNNNGDSADNVSYLFNSTLDRYEDVSGRSVYQSLFDRYGFYVNNRLKYGWTGSNIQAYSEATASSNTDPITGAALTTANADLVGGVLSARSVSSTFPSGDKVHHKIYESYSSGNFIQWDNYIINDEGVVASFADFAGLTQGADFRRKLLDYNYEQVITASEFQGRKIDLVVEPRILIQAGLIQ